MKMWRIMISNINSMSNLIQRGIISQDPIYKSKLATVVEGDQKAPFSMANTPRRREGRYSLWVECSPMAWEIVVQSQFESYQKVKKWYLMPPCLTQHYDVQIKGKVEQSWEWSSTLPYTLV